MKRRDFFTWLGAATVVPMVALGKQTEEKPVKKVLKKKPKTVEYKIKTISDADTDIVVLTNMNGSFEYKFHRSNLELSCYSNSIEFVSDFGQSYALPGRDECFINIRSVPLSVIAQMSIEEYYLIQFYTKEAAFTAQLMLIELPVASTHIDTPDATFYLRFHLVEKRIVATVYNT